MNLPKLRVLQRGQEITKAIYQHSIFKVVKGHSSGTNTQSHHSFMFFGRTMFEQKDLCPPHPVAFQEVLSSNVYARTHLNLPFFGAMLPPTFQFIIIIDIEQFTTNRTR